MKRQSSVSLLVVATLISGLHVMAADNQAQVKVHVTDAFGNSTPPHQMRLLGKSTTIALTQDEVVTLNYGSYTVKVEVPGFSLASVPVLIDQPQQIVTVAMKLGPVENEIKACAVSGKIAPSEDIARIRLLQLFGPYITDVPVRPGGAFEFRNLLCGEYMIIVMGSKGCLATRIARAQALPEPIEVSVDTTGGNACNSTK